ncbi:TPA: type I toxin-antitoxin system SymE family toxin [Elizabethkingia anophelis]|nr:type I addiction module toxin, SymE family [Elizabethkingia anophelis]HAY3537138.1 type I toxin-antitoxin system SymE family toxin [Elizabethkingia anophelis]HAY3549256.1 type I toxin-antitoxin system SymE family toxin [Elizabethkingia anophelis]HAY3594054.1 type I toxin-antitoxin system SymE family toxin [Elizabethkingia anophelis]
MEIRKITVCRKVFSSSNYHPIITICGKWLKKSGFRAGDKLALKVYEKKIIVEIEMPREEFYKEKLIEY